MPANMGGHPWGTHCQTGISGVGGSCSSFYCDCVCFSCLLAKKDEAQGKKEEKKGETVVENKSNNGAPILGFLRETQDPETAWATCFVCGPVKNAKTQMFIMYGIKPDVSIGLCPLHKLVMTELLLEEWVKQKKGMLPGGPPYGVQKASVGTQQIILNVGAKS